MADPNETKRAVVATTATARPVTPGLPWPAILALVAVLLCGLTFYFGVAFRSSGTDAADWGVRGDSVAPFAALLNAGALFAALWAVYEQRIEGHKSGEDTRKQLEKMSEQVAEFARAANAQVALAASQARLAEAQERANAFSVRGVIAQHSQNIVRLAVAAARIEAAIEERKAVSTDIGERFEKSIQATRDGLVAIGKTENEEMGKLNKVLDDAVKRIRGSEPRSENDA